MLSESFEALIEEHVPRETSLLGKYGEYAQLALDSPCYIRPQIDNWRAISTTVTKVKMAPLNSSTITIPLYLLIAIVVTP